MMDARILDKPINLSWSSLHITKRIGKEYAKPDVSGETYTVFK